MDFSPSKGHEQGGRRPALVVSARKFNDVTGLMFVCPITSVQKEFTFEVPITGTIRGAVLTDQIRSVDWRYRNVSYEGQAPKKTTVTVQKILQQIID